MSAEVVTQEPTAREVVERGVGALAVARGPVGDDPMGRESYMSSVVPGLEVQCGLPDAEMASMAAVLDGRPAKPNELSYAGAQVF